jgi:hypothetical protein
MEATPCKCAICRNSRELALKIVVHTGTAVFHKIGGFNKVSGPDVILAHRLLKNSVPDKEYLLMSEAAHSAMGEKMGGPFFQGKESYDGFGSVDTFVRYNGDVKQQHLDSLYKLPRASLVARAELYGIAAVAGVFPALFRQLRSPIVKSGSWPKRLGFALMLMLRAPMIMMMYLIGAPRRLLAQRAGRIDLAATKTEST